MSGRQVTNTTTRHSSVLSLLMEDKWLGLTTLMTPKRMLRDSFQVALVIPGRDECLSLVIIDSRQRSANDETSSAC